ncbi:MAG: hypothetical protein WDO18_05335 [Acidobacteriota bacterium]
MASGLWCLLAIVATETANGQSGPPLTCAASTTPVSLRQGGEAERVSDVLLTCTGGTPYDSDASLIPIPFQITFSVNVSSRSLSSNWSEAFTIVDEPAPSNQLACVATEGTCGMVGTTTGIGTYSGAQGRPNIFQGNLSSATTLAWLVPFDPPGTGQRRFRFANLRVDTTGLPVGSTIVARITANGQLPIALTNSSPVVGTVEQPVDFSITNTLGTTGLTGFTVNIQEHFSNAFKARTVIGPGAGPQTTPGGISLDYETGFYNPNLPNTSNGNLGIAGLADNGTRVRVQLTSVPSSISISVPLIINLAAGQARLVSTGSLGEGLYTPATTGVLPVIAATVNAVYEITQAAGGVQETLQIPFTITNNGSPLAKIDGNIALAPTNLTSGGGTSAIPRFQFGGIFTATPPLTIQTKGPLQRSR